jgi:hypothetical protein
VNYVFIRVLYLKLILYAHLISLDGFVFFGLCILGIGFGFKTILIFEPLNLQWLLTVKTYKPKSLRTEDSGRLRLLSMANPEAKLKNLVFHGR